MELSQVVLCRGLCGEAESYLAKDGDMYVGMAVSVAQDAVELFLRAVMKGLPVAGQKIWSEAFSPLSAVSQISHSRIWPFPRHRSH